MYVDRAHASDGAEKAKWYQAAAEIGNSNAAFNLGEMYLHGIGIPKSYQDALRWFRKAAEAGDSTSRMYLGNIYENGNLGVPKDDVMAYMWFNLAAASSVDSENTAAKLRERLARRLTPTQIAEARQRSREWRPKGNLVRPSP